MIGLAIRLLGLVAGPFHAVVRWALANPLAVLCIGLGVFGVHEKHRADKGWNYAHQLEAQGKANVTSLKAEKAAREALQAQITKDTNDATPSHRRDAVDASNRWADAHRVRPSAAVAASEASGSVSDAPTAAGSPEIPGEAIAVDRNTINACALNSSDLNEAVDWARRTWPKP